MQTHAGIKEQSSSYLLTGLGKSTHLVGWRSSNITRLAEEDGLWSFPKVKLNYLFRASVRHWWPMTQLSRFVPSLLSILSSNLPVWLEWFLLFHISYHGLNGGWELFVCWSSQYFSEVSRNKFFPPPFPLSPKINCQCYLSFRISVGLAGCGRFCPMAWI